MQFKIFNYCRDLICFNCVLAEDGLPLGIYLVQMHARRKPFPTIIHKDHMDSEFCKIIKTILPGMLEYDSSNRPGIDEVMQMVSKAKGKYKPLNMLYTFF